MKNHLQKLSFHLVLCYLITSCTGEPKYPKSLFQKVDADHTNIHFVNHIPENNLTNSFVYEYVYNGAGVATADFNNDGREDIYLISNLHDNKMYLNQGDFEFEDITDFAGVKGFGGWSTGVSIVDIDQNGLLDIYICKSGPYEKSALLKNELYVNQGIDSNGRPKFLENAKAYGLDVTSNSMQAAFFDYDKDNDLDMYLMNHNPMTYGNGNTEHVSPYGDKFFENINGKYVDKTQASGIYSNAISYGLGIGVQDLNQDSWPDIYISNDYDEPDYLYINQKDGTFKEVLKTGLKHVSNFSMGNDIADFDNDLYPDIVTLDMVSEDNYGQKTSMASMNPEKFENNVSQGKHYQYMYNAMQQHSTYIDSTGTPYFSDVAQMLGISNTDWSWAPLLADFNNDGKKDLFISNGIKRDFRNKDYYNFLQDYLKKNSDALGNKEKIEMLIDKTPHRPAKNYIYQNMGNLSFTNQSDHWFEGIEADFSNGAAYADFDNDGDLDLVINHIDKKASVLKNTSTEKTGNSHVTITLVGPKGNINGLGTRVTVFQKGERQTKVKQPVRGYLSSVSHTLNFGLTSPHIDSLRIQWPDGYSQVLDNLSESKIELAYAHATAPLPKKSAGRPLFEPLNHKSAPVHIENDFDDYGKQVLLPHKLSQSGPAVTYADLNGDGLDDMYFGQSSGQVSAIYLQHKNGEFRPYQLFEKDKDYEDVDALFFDIDQDNDFDLYVVSGGNEFSAGSPLYQDRLYINENGKFIKGELPTNTTSGSVIKVADIDKNGFPDVLVCGRHIPGQYPKPSSSALYLNQSGTLKDVTLTNAKELLEIGMVTDASISDYDADGDEDILLVGEWMEPKILSNSNGHFKLESIHSKMNLDGWYFSITPLDFDADGDLDYLLGNIGNNYKYKASQKEPFEVFHGDLDQNGSYDIILGYYNFGELFPVRGRQCSSEQMPSVKKAMPTYDLFGKSNLKDIYGSEKMKLASHLTAHNFSSGIWVNKGSNSFSFKPFPSQLQIAAINDFYTRRLETTQETMVFIVGNLYGSEIETPRNDASYGQVFNLNKKGEVKVLSTKESGWFNPYEGKTINRFNTSTGKLFSINNNNGPILFFQKTGGFLNSQ